MRGRQRGSRSNRGGSGERRYEGQGPQGSQWENGWGDEREWDAPRRQGSYQGGYERRGPQGYQGGRPYEGEGRGYEEGSRFEDGETTGRWGSRYARFPGSSSFGGGDERRGYQGSEEDRDEETASAQRSYGSFSEGEYGGEGRQRQSRGRGRGQERGQHTGRGPKGYQRSDERVREDVCEALSQHGDVDASEITVEVRGGEVILTGTVDSREAKREAERAVEDAPGVKEVQNQLRVQQKGQENYRSQADGSTSTQQRGTTGSADREQESRSRSRSTTGANM
jgi:osmotically-inducible protein OsmY